MALEGVQLKRNYYLQKSVLEFAQVFISISCHFVINICKYNNNLSQENNRYLEHTYKRKLDTDPGAINLQMNRHLLELSQLCLEGLGAMCLIWNQPPSQQASSVATKPAIPLGVTRWQWCLKQYDPHGKVPLPWQLSKSMAQVIYMAMQCFPDFKYSLLKYTGSFDLTPMTSVCILR